jgi:MSHA biogenesis protein MshJ
MTLKHYWKKFLRAVNRLKIRERQLLTFTSSVIVVAAFFMGSWQPLYMSWQKSGLNIVSVQNDIDKTRAQIIETKAASEKDANQPYRQKAERLNKNIADQQVRIETITAALINPKYMNQVFSTLLQSSELEINKVNNQQAESIDIEGQSEPANLLYKHGLSLEMKGTFNNSLKYLKRVENQDWHLYWDELTFTTQKYPYGVLTLNVHTLSTSDHVLGL